MRATMASIGLLGFLFVSSPALVSCRPRVVVVERRPECPGGVWIEGHRGPRGRWHPGHWRCPGVVEVVEVE
jgi:hypothetical protein